MADDGDTAGSTFFATEFDAGQAEEAVRKLAAAFDASCGDATDSGAVGEAMGLATSAFPGLQDFVEAMEDRGEDVRDAVLDLAGVGPGHDILLKAAAKLALVGAISEVNQGFDWQEASDCASLCRDAVTSLPDASAVPSRR